MTDGSNLQEGSTGGRKAVRISLTFDDFRSFITQYASHISMGGMFIGTRSPLPPGTLCKLDVKLKDGYSIVSGLGEVVWTRERSEGPERPPGMGVRFRELEDKSKDLIFAIVDRRLVEGSGVDPSQGGDGVIAGEDVPDLEDLLRSAGRRREEAESRLTPPHSASSVADAVPATSAPELGVPAEPAPEENAASTARFETDSPAFESAIAGSLLPDAFPLEEPAAEAPLPEPPAFDTSSLGLPPKGSLGLGADQSALPLEPPPVESPAREPSGQQLDLLPSVDDSALEETASSFKDLSESLMDDSLGGDVSPGGLDEEIDPISDLSFDALAAKSGLEPREPLAEGGTGFEDSALEDSEPPASGWPEPKSPQLPPLELPPLEAILQTKDSEKVDEVAAQGAIEVPDVEPSSEAEPSAQERIEGAPPEGLEDVWSRLDELEEESRDRSLDPGALPTEPGTISSLKRDVEEAASALPELAAPVSLPSESLPNEPLPEPIKPVEPYRPDLPDLVAELTGEEAPVGNANQGIGEDLGAEGVGSSPWDGGAGGAAYYATPPRRSKALWWLIPIVLVVLGALAWAAGFISWPLSSSDSRDVAGISSDSETGGPGEGGGTTATGRDEASGVEPEILTPGVGAPEESSDSASLGTAPDGSATEVGDSGSGSSGSGPSDAGLLETGASENSPENATAGSSGQARSDSAPLPPPTEPEPRTPMTKVTDISFQELQGSTRLVITTDGRIIDGKYKYVRINSGSPRLLVRLMGIKQGYPQVAVPVSTAQARQVRLGYHPDKGQGELHIVVDLAGRSVQATSVERQGARLVVTLE